MTKLEIETKVKDLKEAFDAFLAENPAPANKTWQVGGDGQLRLVSRGRDCQDEHCDT